MRLIGYKQIKGTIEVLTGLHIGGNAAIIEIGGSDNPIIKHPITNEPYIPGSSLKGKMRSLLEWRLNKISGNGQVHGWCNDPGCPICRIFGTAADEAKIGPTRLIVRDALLCKSYVDECKKRNPHWIPSDITEQKSENSLNRITAKATPRNIERVVAGTRFALDMLFRMFNGGFKVDDEALFEHVIEGLRMIEMDALGGSGSRGCGQVRFLIRSNGGNEKSVQQLNATDFPTQTIGSADE